MSRLIAPGMRNGFPFAIPSRGKCRKLQMQSSAYWAGVGEIEVPKNELADPGDDKYALWDGSTFYEFTDTKTWVDAYDATLTYTATVSRKVASNSTQYITPIVGTNTCFVRLPRADAEKLFWRIRRTTLTGNAKFEVPDTPYGPPASVEVNALDLEGLEDTGATEPNLLIEKWNAWERAPTTTANYWQIEWLGAEYPDVTIGPLLASGPATPAMRYGLQGTGAHYGSGVATGTPGAQQIEAAPKAVVPVFVCVESDADYIYVDARSLLDVASRCIMDALLAPRPPKTIAALAERRGEHLSHVLWESSNPIIPSRFFYFAYGNNASSLGLTVCSATQSIPAGTGWYAEGWENLADVTKQDVLDNTDPGTVSGNLELAAESYWGYDGLWSEGSGAWVGI